MKIGETIQIKGKDHEWTLEVQDVFLKICYCDYILYEHSPNTVKEFFKDLGIDSPIEFLTEVYGYSPMSGGWPEWKGPDDEMSDKILKAINKVFKQPKTTYKVILDCEEFLLL